MDIGSFYKIALRAYLIEHLSLDSLDAEIANSSMRFQPVCPDEQCELQKNCLLKLKYIYLANSVHIERLNDNDVAILEKCISEYEESGSISPEVMRIIDHTYNNLLLPEPAYNKQITPA